MMSLGPPGGNGTISRICLAGKSCALVAIGVSSSDKPPASAVATRMAPPGRTARVLASRWARPLPGNPTTALLSCLAGISVRQQGSGVLLRCRFVQQFQRGLVHAGVAGGDDAAAVLGGLAFPG